MNKRSLIVLNSKAQLLVAGFRADELNLGTDQKSGAKPRLSHLLSTFQRTASHLCDSIIEVISALESDDLRGFNKHRTIARSTELLIRDIAKFSGYYSSVLDSLSASAPSCSEIFGGRINEVLQFRNAIEHGTTAGRIVESSGLYHTYRYCVEDEKRNVIEVVSENPNPRSNRNWPKEGCVFPGLLALWSLSCISRAADYLAGKLPSRADNLMVVNLITKEKLRMFLSWLEKEANRTTWALDECSVRVSVSPHDEDSSIDIEIVEH